ncbi:MAG: MinD/ParA family protein [Thiotrichales bacterium]
MEPKPIKVIAVTSGKGGVGKTTLSANLAAQLALRDHQVMLLDADLGLANIDVLLGLRPRYNLFHVLSGERTLDEVVIHGPGGLLIVPAASGVQRMSDLSKAEHVGLIRAFSTLTHPVDTLIIDTAAGISDSVMSFCNAAHEVIVVACEDPSSLADSYALIKVLNRDYGVRKFQVLANMVETEQAGLAVYRRITDTTDRFLDVNVAFLGSVPQDEFIRRANQQRKLLTQSYPHSRGARALERIAARIEALAAPEVPTGRLEFFFERLLAQEAV